MQKRRMYFRRSHSFSREWEVAFTWIMWYYERNTEEKMEMNFVKKKSRRARRRSPVIPMLFSVVLILLVMVVGMLFYVIRQTVEETVPETTAETVETTRETTAPETTAQTEPTTEATTESTTEPTTEPEETEEIQEAPEEPVYTPVSGGGGAASGGSASSGGIHSVPCAEGAHNWVDLPSGPYNQKVNCTQDGRATQVCGNCLELRWVVTTPAYGHDWQVIAVYPPKVGGYGYTEMECTWCHTTKTTDLVDPLPFPTIPEPAETEPQAPAEPPPAPS